MDSEFSSLLIPHARDCQLSTPGELRIRHVAAAP